MLNVLLQVLDDGRITDGQGRTVDFKNTIIILTSNLGSDIILEGINRFGDLTDEVRESVNQLLKTHFRPEFLNRLDEIIVFKPLTNDDLSRIVDLLIADLQKRLAQKQLSCTVTDEAKRYIIDAGADPLFGARPLKRFIQSHVESLIARYILAEDPEPDTALTVDYDGQKLFIR